MGRWRGQELLHPVPWQPQGGTAWGCFDYCLELAGLFLTVSYEQTSSSPPSPGDGRLFEGRGIYGWDGQSYVMHWVDSGGGGGLFLTGDWVEGQWTYTSPSARYIHRVEGDIYRFRLELASPEGWQPYIEGTYHRE